LWYILQDSEAKKTDKKDSNGPPLQTASVSVRALIEEKIIQKRITNPALQAASAQANFTPATTAATAASSTQNGTLLPLTFVVFIFF